MWLIWHKSMVNDDCGVEALSRVEIRVKSESINPINAFSQGTKLPICAMYTIRPERLGVEGYDRCEARGYTLVGYYYY
jgi:hypothetical protein